MTSSTRSRGLKTEQIPIGELVLDPANARKHSKKNLEAIKGSLAKFGVQKPIVVGQNNVVIAGNGTVTAARELGWKTIPAVRTLLSGPEAIAYALSDNRTSELAEWDFDVLGATLHSLREIDFDLTSIGFDTSYIDGLNPDFKPGTEGDQGKLDEKAKVSCPECGHAFAP